MKTYASSRSVLGSFGAVIAILIVVAVVVALQPPPTFDPGTPEATAQGYFNAVNEADRKLAETYMTADLVDRCDEHYWYYEEERNSRVVITDSKIDGDTAKLDVTITVSYGEGPFGGGGYDEDETVVMERVGDVWLISEPAWPMDRWACGERG